MLALLLELVQVQELAVEALALVVEVRVLGLEEEKAEMLLVLRGSVLVLELLALVLVLALWVQEVVLELLDVLLLVLEVWELISEELLERELVEVPHGLPPVAL